ncbi:MAG TPA: hypothetical protein VJ989_07145 [Solirubrobacterales bacterium]|nr:hypothetical protein [Solirubrobacterales bacterium]
MADSTTVAIVSVAVTGAVGLSAPFAAYFNQKQRFHKEREDKDLGELREMLDSAAQTVASTMETAGHVSGDIRDCEVDSADGQEHLNALRGQVVLVMDQAQRLAIRIGRDHPVARSYWAFWSKIAELLEAADDPAEEEKDREEQLGAIREAIKEERRTFLERACSVAGSTR